MKTKEPMFEYLESICELIPVPFYWLDTNGAWINLNELDVIAVGAKSKADVIGKTVHELYKNKAIADELQHDIDTVIKTGIPSLCEDKIIDVTTGKIRYYSATKAPIRNKNNEIIGVLGTSIEITAEKEATIAQNKALQAITIEQAKFKTTVKQMMHDMTSPVTSIENIVRKLGSNIPEISRVTLKSASDRIQGISQKLVSSYNNEEDESSRHVPFLPSLALKQLLNEKREEYIDSGITFELNLNPLAEVDFVDIDQSSNFCFIQHNIGMFKRMASNLINNAVDALKGRAEGTVTLKLRPTSAHKELLLSIIDNGPGMPKHVIEKFEVGESMTEGKENGHGIGLTQVYDTIKAGNGKFNIHSRASGTRIDIFFPMVAVPHWMTTTVRFAIADTIIILDDDESIHHTWDGFFEDMLTKYPTLKIRHYYHGKDAIAYINTLSPEEKQNIFLLTDYELLDQGMNGLNVVEKTEIFRAILVTSYATQSDIQNRVISLGIKSLPKELATAATISIDKKLPKFSSKVDMVWVEDLAWYVNQLIENHYSHLKVDVYHDPMSFMADVHQYPLNTRIILDTLYEAPNGQPYHKTGYDLARELHALGYTKLILLAGEMPNGKTPDYLQIVSKGAVDGSVESLDKI